MKFSTIFECKLKIIMKMTFSPSAGITYKGTDKYTSTKDVNVQMSEIRIKPTFVSNVQPNGDSTRLSGLFCYRPIRRSKG